MAIKMKIFDVNDNEGNLTGSGGYILGEGNLPPDFDPDKFMAKFSSHVIMRMMIAQRQGEPIPADIKAMVEEELNKIIVDTPAIESDNIPLLEE
jgi:hypothetical protein